MERLKKGIVEGGVSLGKVEQAVGKVAEGIDVYLILAVSCTLSAFFPCYSITINGLVSLCSPLCCLSSLSV